MLMIKKNDMVKVIAGRDAGKSGKVLQIDAAKRRVTVEHVQMIKRHTRPNPQKNIKGGIVEREAPLAASNVQLVCPECSAPTRVGRRLLDGGRRVRFCRKCKGVVDK